MRLTIDELNRATLARQFLLRRVDLPVTEAVHRVVALQAQEPASPYVALWNRIADFAPAELDAAFAAGAVVKASLLRITLHAVTEPDWAGFHRAMLPVLRGARLGDRRFTDGGHSVDDADTVLPDLLAFARRPRTGPEILEFLSDRVGGDSAGLWWALRTFAPLHRVPSGGAWSFEARSAFRAAPPPPGAGSDLDARARLLERYLAGFGPAAVRDFSQFTLLSRAAAREAVDALGDRVESFDGPDGVTLYDLSGAARPAADVVAPPRLLGMWDSVLLAYADRSRLVPPPVRPFVIRRNGDVLPTLLVDGRVAGLWRVVDGGIEATTFERLAEPAWDGLAEEARRLLTFLGGRDPQPYRRYHHWWDKPLPRFEVRVLGTS